jgi:FtsH-binding integral membrane protein
MIFWMVSISVSVMLLVISAAGRAMDPQMAYVHMAVAALVALVFALIAMRDTRKLIHAGAPRNAIYASTTRFMGLVWSWAALALVITYGTGILQWANWHHFFTITFVLAGLCLFLSLTIRKDVERGTADDKVLQLGGVITTLQLAGMVAVIVSLAFNRSDLFAVSGGESWAANHIFLFTALALAATSAYTLKAAIGEAK